MVNFAHSSATWVRVAKPGKPPLRHGSKKESRTNKRSIKGDRLQLADPANFIHGELSRVDRQWTPLRLIVRKGRRKIDWREREKERERERGRRIPGYLVWRYTRKIFTTSISK